LFETHLGTQVKITRRIGSRAMFYGHADWSERSNTQMPDRMPLIDVIRTLALALLISVCCASWWFDPLSPQNTGPAGYLGIPLDFSFNFREPCRVYDAKFTSCRREHPVASNEANEPKGWLEDIVQKAQQQQRSSAQNSGGGFSGLLRKAGGMVEVGSSSLATGISVECGELKVRGDSCNQAARGAKEKAQLRCANEVTAHWTCLQLTTAVEDKQKGKKSSVCPLENELMNVCARKVFEYEMDLFREK